MDLLSTQQRRALCARQPSTIVPGCLLLLIKSVVFVLLVNDPCNIGMANKYALLADLDEEAMFGDVPTPLPVKGGQLPGAKEEMGAPDEKLPHVRAPRATPVFDRDMSVKRLTVAPVHITKDETAFPPLRVASVRDAKKASAMSQGGFFGAKDGTTVIAYGSYADGSLQV